MQVNKIVELISIHAPLCGGRLMRTTFQVKFCYFNPRPPVRGATLWRTIKCQNQADFNPRPPVRGATKAGLQVFSRLGISIHAPLCGGRPFIASATSSSFYFNPRPPVRGATRVKLAACNFCLFQSTPPCAGGDITLAQHL